MNLVSSLDSRAKPRGAPGLPPVNHLESDEGYSSLFEGPEQLQVVALSSAVSGIAEPP